MLYANGLEQGLAQGMTHEEVAHVSIDAALKAVLVYFPDTPSLLDVELDNLAKAAAE
jgi:hypothetical protein